MSEYLHKSHNVTVLIYHMDRLVPHRWTAEGVGEVRSCSMADWLISLVRQEAEIFMPFAVFFAFITSQKHADSFASEKQLCNRVGLHRVRFESVFRRNETLWGEKHQIIVVPLSNCESWANVPKDGSLCCVKLIL